MQQDRRMRNTWQKKLTVELKGLTYYLKGSIATVQGSEEPPLLISIKSCKI